MSVMHRLVAALPPDVLKRIGALQFTSPTAYRLMRAGTAWMKRRDVIIRHGEGAGLRFNAAGSNAGYALGTTEPGVQAHLMQLLNPGDVFYDIGANVGFFAVLGAKRVGKDGSVYAFDPVPSNVVGVRHNALINGFDHLACFEAAVGATEGRAELLLAGETIWAKLASTGARPDTVGAIEVDVITLDAHIARLGLRPPTLIKVDVEGAELDVVAGMRETLAKHKPTLLVEMHGTNAAFKALMAELGYDAKPLEGDGPLEDADQNCHALATPRS